MKCQNKGDFNESEVVANLYIVNYCLWSSIICAQLLKNLNIYLVKFVSKEICCWRHLFD